MKWIVFIAAFFIFSAGPVASQEGSRPGLQIKKKKVIRYKKKTKVDLDDSLIEGQVLKPDRIEFDFRLNKRFRKLLRPRRDFLREVREDIDFIR